MIHPQSIAPSPISGPYARPPVARSFQPAATTQPKFSGLIDQWMIRREKAKHISNELPAFQNSSVAVLPDNEMYLPTLLSLIDGAKDSIKIDCFYIGGAMGKTILGRLEKAAERGVKIYYRGDMCTGLDNKEMVVPVRERLNRLGLNMSRFFYSEHYRQDVFQVVGTNHNKLFIADNNTAFLSTKNPCDGDADNRDVSMLLRGPAVQDMVKHFNKSWLGLNREVLDDKPGRFQPLPLFLASQMRTHSCRPLVSSNHLRNALPGMLEMIDSAEHSIKLHGFVLTNREIIDALTKIVQDPTKRHLKIQILLDNNETYPLRIPNGVVFQEFLELMKDYTNVEIRAYKHHSLHAEKRPTRKQLHKLKNHNKMLVVDDKKAIVGSTNFTHADVWHQENMSVQLDGGPGAKRLAKVFEDDWEINSLAIRPLSWLERLGARIVKWLYEF
jgi:phosphatidylserine/phosphatidylglycerophosphate/cardiolipin synthase-like enzyme